MNFYFGHTRMIVFFLFFYRYYGEGKANGTGETSQSDVAIPVNYKKIFKRSWMYFATGYINYGTTLCIFPALTSLGKCYLGGEDKTALALRLYYIIS